jgi:hypothetical protein
MLTIEKPRPEFEIALRSRYPFADMLVGDSFLITDHRKAESARISAIHFAKRQQDEWKFTMRKMRDGWRLFRIA